MAFWKKKTEILSASADNSGIAKSATNEEYVIYKNWDTRLYVAV